MKKLKIIIISIIVCFLLFWGGSIVRCEVLTYLHGKEFETLYKANTMIIKPDYLKLLNYSDSSARVYYVTKHEYGNIMTFEKQDNQWVFNKWESTVWSSSGSADGFVWPYVR